jgi:iron-sulfur cluster assembly protein
MVSTSYKAAEQLREELINKCFEAGIGFRMLVNAAEPSEATFSIRLDMQHRGDEVVESNGVRVFLDPASAARISDYQLDYQDEPDGGFFLKTAQEAKSG